MADAREPAPITPESLPRLVAQRVPIVLILDYDAIVVPRTDHPDRASPDPDLLRILRELGERPDRRVHLLVGRTRAQTERWFGRLPVSLHAEHGVWSRNGLNEPWRRNVEPVHAWPSELIDALSKARAMLPGSVLEARSASLAFDFRGVRPDWVASTVPWLRRRLAEVSQGEALVFVDGAELLEVRAPGVTRALPARLIRQQTPTEGVLLAIGDGAAGEELFRALDDAAMTIRVGAGQSIARYRVEGSADARRLLTALT